MRRAGALAAARVASDPDRVAPHMHAALTAARAGRHTHALAAACEALEVQGLGVYVGGGLVDIRAVCI